MPPNTLSEHWHEPDRTAFQGIAIDYRRLTPTRCPKAAKSIFDAQVRVGERR